MKNVGGIDKNLRIVLGLILIASTFFCTCNESLGLGRRCASTNWII